MFRWNKYAENHQKPKRGEEHFQAVSFVHFSSNTHNSFLEDFSITLIDKTDRADPTKRDKYWKEVLKTVTLHGFNTVD